MVRGWAFGFVFELPADLAQARIADAAPERLAAHAATHRLDGQIFDRDYRGAGRQLVLVIPSTVRNPCVPNRRSNRRSCAGFRRNRTRYARSRVEVDSVTAESKHRPIARGETTPAWPRTPASLGAIDCRAARRSLNRELAARRCAPNRPKSRPGTGGKGGA